MRKSKINAFRKSAAELLGKTKYTMVVWQVYANSAYILDTEEDNVLEVCRNEIDAINYIKAIDEESGFKSGCYYKPILIDKDSGGRVTRENLKDYLIK